MGASYVEREGVSVRHASRFLLVGTMNPEEGELRPQLLDRFGLTVEVAASRDPEERVEVVRRRLAHDDDPAGFAARWADDERELRERVAAARALLPAVELDDAALRQIAAACAAFEVDGMRADIVMARTAVALAAWAGRTRVESADVRQAALLALPHRRRRNPFDAPGLDEDKLDRTLEENSEPDGGPGPEGPEEPGGPDGPDDGPAAAGRTAAAPAAVARRRRRGRSRGTARAASRPSPSSRSRTPPSGPPNSPARSPPPGPRRRRPTPGRARPTPTHPRGPRAPRRPASRSRRAP